MIYLEDAKGLNARQILCEDLPPGKKPEGLLKAALSLNYRGEWGFVYVGSTDTLLSLWRSPGNAIFYVFDAQGVLC